jgi:hypothetical protein
VIRTEGLDEAQEERARRVVLGIIGREADRLSITIARDPTGKLVVTVDDPTPRTRASLLPEVETAQAFADLVGVLTIALQDALG